MFSFKQAYAPVAALLAALTMVQPMNAAAAALTVSTQDELEAALHVLEDGDTILLSPATFAELKLDGSDGRDLDFSEQVTIASADPDRPAIINRMRLRRASNIEIRDVKFAYAPSGTEEEARPFSIQGASRITLDGVALEGHVKNGFGVGVGLLVRRSEDVALIASEVSRFRNGLHVANSKAVTIRGNDFIGMSNDSMILGGIKDAKIEGNHFHDQKSRPTLKHKDSIQFHTRSGTSSSIEIRNNRIENPEVSHSIFLGNNMAREGDLDAYYTDIVIEDNFIRGAHAHGITIEHGLRVRIEDNTILQNPDLSYTEPVNVPIINVSSLSKDVTIKRNRVASVPKAQDASWNVSENAIGGRKLRHWYGDYPPLGARKADEPSGEARTDDGAYPRPRPTRGEAESVISN